MKISSEIVGSTLKEFTAYADRRHTTNYAAAINDYNPRYFDDENPEEMIAHPMFAVALSWPLIANISEYTDLKDYTSLLFTIVHYSEYLNFHRPLKPGETLKAKGRIAAIIPRRGGTHIIFEIPFKDKKGHPVFTEYIGGLLRGVECSDAGKGKDDIPLIPEAANNNTNAENLLPLWEHSEYISPGAPYIYDACSDIVFAIHTSPSFARSVGLPGIILQGTATLALAVRELINKEADKMPELLTTLSCRFRSMVFPKEDINIRLLEKRSTTEGKELFFDVINKKGEKAISDGFALIKKQ